MKNLIVRFFSLSLSLDSCVSRKEDELVLSRELLAFTRTHTHRLSVSLLMISTCTYYIYISF